MEKCNRTLPSDLRSSPVDRYERMLKNFNQITAQQERWLFHLLNDAKAEGNEALIAECRYAITFSKLRLAFRMIMKSSIPIHLSADCLNECAATITKKIDCYDVNRSAQFSTYITQ